MPELPARDRRCVEKRQRLLRYCRHRASCCRSRVALVGWELWEAMSFSYSCAYACADAGFSIRGSVGRAPHVAPGFGPAA